MTSYLLDTNVVIAVINGRPEKVRSRLKAAWQAGDRLLVSTITLYELCYGIAKSRRQRENMDRLHAFMSGRIEVLPFNEEHAEPAGLIRAVQELNGKPIGPYDLLLAAQARHHRLTLVTANFREFAQVGDLTVEDWSV